MSPEQVQRCERALGRHLVWLKKALADEKRDPDDLHLTLAGQLRVLLCDATERPILIRYAEHKRVGLRVWGPNPAHYAGIPGKVVLQFNPLIAASTPVPDGYEMSISDYLVTPVGAIPEPVPAGVRPTKTLWYTPEQLIKWAANKEGVSHLQPNPHASLEAIKGSWAVSGTAVLQGVGDDVTFGANDDFILRSAILQIARWTVGAVEQVLAV